MSCITKIVVGIGLAALMVKAKSQSVDEYTLKAIWIGKITHFIDWPEESANNTKYFIIATIYEDPFNGKLEEIYNDYKIWNKEVKILHLTEYDPQETVHILYIPPLKKEVTKNILEKTKNTNTLLIGDTEGYAHMGVHINFFLDGQHVRFEINESAIRNSNLFVSYRLLNIARIIDSIEKQ